MSKSSSPFSPFLPHFFCLSLSLSLSILLLDPANARDRHEQLILRANALREELHTETMRMLNDIIKFKMHVQKNLEDYETFVAEELEQELGTDELKEDTRAMDM